MKKITLLIALILCTQYSSQAQDPVTYQQAFPNLSFEYPVEIQNAKDGSDRLFVVEQSGRIKVFQNNSSTSSQSVFLDLRSEVSFYAGLEIGLLGMAFHPNYSQNGYFYVYYTRISSVPGINTEVVLSRFQVSSNPNLAIASSRVEIFSFDKNQAESNHNGGKIAFGPDGYLYASVGDGGGGGDPQGNGQNLNTIFGSILRIDVDVDGSNPIESNPDAPNGQYEIPSDNPRRGQSGLDELYSWGIRNTWKFSFDNTTNRMWGADVGQGAEEEINIIQRGGNYGWRRFEGTSTYSSSSLVTSPDIKPVYRYNHNNGDVSITGGYVYRGSSNNTAIKGKYIYGDYVTGRVWALDYNGSTATSSLLFRTNGEFVSTFGLDEAGEMYFSSYGTSAKLYKIVGGNEEPTGPTTIAVNGIGEWKELDNGTNGIVDAVLNDGDDTYVAGSFTTVGGTNATNIAVYNKNTGWSSLSSGANGRVSALAVASDGRVYAGGSFSSIGGVAAQNVAMWNGTSWSALGSGTNGAVAKIGIDGNNNIYVGGAFSTAGGIQVNNIARYNSGWEALGDSGTSVVGTDNEIRAIAFDTNNTLYIGGNFGTAGGRTANRIATWNGSNWSTLGEGTSGFVQAIVVTPESVYAGGNFSLAGGQTVNRVARWVRGSSSWQAMGTGLSGNVNAMVFDGNYLYAGGNFETAANDASTNRIMKNIARWNVSQGWQAMGPGTAVGVNNVINDIDFSDDNQRMYVGGNYGTAGGVTAKNIGVWSEQGFDCSDEQLVTEYRIDGAWSSGASSITVDEGAEVVLSIIPDNVDFSVTSPNGNTVSGDYNLGAVTQSAQGIYTFVTSGGCQTTLNLEVNVSNSCNASSVVPEFRLGNGAWISGESQTTTDQGTDITLSIQPNDIPFTILLPNGTTVNGDYTISNIQPAQQGTYTFTTEAGCSDTFTITVIPDSIDCPAGSITQEYQINGTWSSGLSSIDVQVGAPVVLSMLPNNLGLTITLPNGNEVGDNYSLGAVTTAQSGLYVLTSAEGCTANLQVNVVDDTACQPGSVIPEYQLDGVWNSGQTSLNASEGEALTLSILPNSIDVVITLPNGVEVGDNYRLAALTAADAGTYLFETPEGCTTSLTLGVSGNSNCAPGSIINEYRIDGLWSSGSDQLNVTEGTEVTLSMLPNGVPVTITTPSGQQFGDNYNLGAVTSGQSGTYTLRTEEGCVSTIDLLVDNGTGPCSGGVIIPEYRLDGVWNSGNDQITVDEGTDVVLSMLPNYVDLTITTPNGVVVGDDYQLGNVTPGQSGVYTLETGAGCVQTITLNVTDLANCDADSVIPEYRLNGVWHSGERFLRLKEGTEVMLSILTNDTGMTITAPDGRKFGNDYNLGSFDSTKNGIYVLTTAQGCKATLQLYAPPSAGGRANELNNSVFDFASLNNEAGAGISAYPNPTTETVTVGVRGLAREGFTLIVSDMGQQQLLTEEFDADHPDEIQVDLGNFSSGIYFLIFKEADGSIHSQRVIKN